MSAQPQRAGRRPGIFATITGMLAAIAVLTACRAGLEPLLSRRLDKPVAHYAAFAVSLLLSVLAYTVVLRAVSRTDQAD